MRKLVELLEPSTTRDQKLNIKSKLTNGSYPITRLARLGGALGAGLAFCLTLAGQASASVPGYERVIKLSADNSSSKRTVTVTCPAGKKLVGASARVWSTHPDIGFQHAVLDDITPNSTLTTLTVTGFEDGLGTASNWYLEAIANCADPLDGLERVVATSVSNSSFTKSVTATCPAGKLVVGTGGEITGGLGRVVIDEIRPSSTLNSVLVTGYEDVNGTGINWTVTAYAICATAPAGLQRISGTSVTDSNSKWVQAACPSGTVLLGSGGEITGGLGKVTMLTFGPANPLSMVNQTTGIEILTGTSANWTLSSYAICATN